MNLTFDGIKRSWVQVLERKPDRIAPIEWLMSSVPERRGAIPLSKKIEVRQIPVTIGIEADSFDMLQKRIEEVTAWLVQDEPKPLIFDTEPDRVYYALFNGDITSNEFVTYGKLSFTFICPDSYKYSVDDQTAILNADTGSIINAAGTAPAEPVFELTASQPSTMAMIANDKGDFMMVGEPLDVEAAPFRKETRILTDEMNALTGWTTTATGISDHAVAGTMQIVSGSMRPSTFGTGDGYHGPTMTKALAEPLTDFKLEALVDFDNMADPNVVGNIEIYLLDANGIVMGRIGLRDSSSGYRNVFGQARAGQKFDSRTLINEQGDRAGVWNDFHGMLRITRQNNVWQAYIAKIDPTTGRHHTRRNSDPWTDRTGRFTAPVSQIVVGMQQYRTYATPDMRINKITVDRLNEQAGVPYIVYEGDKVTFDHRGKGKILINGEDAKDLKHFAAWPFPLNPGSNTVAVMPEGTFTGTVNWTDTFK